MANVCGKFDQPFDNDFGFIIRHVNQADRFGGVGALPMKPAVRALELDPFDGWSHLYFGNLLYALKCYAEALTHFRYAADFLPNNGCPYWCMGDTYHALDDIENADLHYHKAVEIDPDDRTAMQNLERWLAIKQG